MRSAGSNAQAATAQAAAAQQAEEDGARPATPEAGSDVDATAEVLGYPHYPRGGGHYSGPVPQQQQYLPEVPLNYLAQAANVKYFEWVATWKDLAPDGYTKPVRGEESTPYPPASLSTAPLSPASEPLTRESTPPPCHPVAQPPGHVACRAFRPGRYWAAVAAGKRPSMWCPVGRRPCHLVISSTCPHALLALVY